YQATNTVANKVNFSNVLITAGSTLNAENTHGAGAKGSMVFAGDLQGTGTLNVDTVGTTNTNSLTLGHSENSFTGNVTVTSGKLQFTVNGYDNVTYTGTNALVNASAVSVASGATIDVASTTQTFNNLSGAGNITLADGGSATLNNTTPTEFSGVISDTGYVTKTGAETLTLSGANDYSGGTSISEGKIVLTGNGTLGTGDVTIEENATLEFAHESNQNVSNNISGYGSVIKSGSETLTLSNGWYSGETTVSGGTLIFPINSSPSTSLVTVKSGATLQMGASLYGAVDIQSGGTLDLDIEPNAYFYLNSLSLDEGTINFDFYDSNNNIYDNINVYNSANLSSGVINLTFNDSSADDWLTVINDNYSGALPLISGSIVDYTTFNNNNSVTVSVNGSPSTDWKLTADSNGLYLSPNGASGEPWYYANTSDINLDSWTIDGTNKQGVKFTEGGESATFAGGVTMSANGTFDIGSNQTLTVSNVISGDGALIKTGEGTLELSGDNTFTGGTTISEGTLKLTKADIKGTLATGSTVTVDGETSVLTGHGDILGYSDKSVGTINLQNGGTLHNDSDNAHITVGAVINMNNGVISAEDGWGNGTFGNFVFDNAINVLGGTDNKITALKITLRQYQGTSDEEVGGKITVAEGAKLTISSQIADHNSAKVVPLVKLGAGELVLSGDCTYTAGTYVYGGTLRLEKVGDKGTLATGSTVTVDGATSVLAGH
ncbi:MAG: autotransporter-associated beta strand repeat-containing protein, partial [Thermoguttaceae bacterium]|nr:autotransporter-associated beta strand repeat-containing protein [Thermoguttaceae bacterium]